VPGDRLALQESDRVTNGDGGAGVETDEEEDLAMETALERSQRPSTRPTTARESRARTGEPLWPRITGWLRRKLQTRGRIFRAAWIRRKDFAGEAVFARNFEGVGVLLLGRVEREGEDGFAGRSGLGGER